MAGHRAARSIVVLAVLVIVGACGSTTTARNAPKPQLRGVAVRRFVCPPHRVSAAQQVTPIGQPRALLLCPLSVPGPTGRPVRVTPQQAQFAALIDALSAPDVPLTTGACPAYADVPQFVLASSPRGVFEVSIPVDACHHYQQAALDALSRARKA
jgi:hypothetical protein